MANIKDMTTGNPTKIIFYFAMPMLIGNLFQQFYTMVDAMIVGKFVGVNALAAVGATNALNFFIISLVIGLMSGVSVVVAQYFGFQDYHRLKQVIATASIMIGLVSVVLTIIGIALAKPLLLLLQTPKEILDDSVLFMTTLFIGILPMGLYNGVSAILRALGNSITPLYFLIISSLLNIALSFLFVVGLGVGVAGAAWATVVSQLVSAILCIIYGYRHVLYMRLKKKDLHFDRAIFKEIFRIALPSALQGSFISIGNMAIQGLINSFGATVVAAYTAASRIDSLTYQPGIAFGAASSMFAGQNIGAGKIDRVKEGFWSGIKVVTVVSLAITVLVQIFAHQFLMLFLDSSATEALSIGTGYLKIVSLFYVVVGILFVVRETLRGTGDAIVPLWMGIFELASRLAIGFILSQFLGYMGLWWATPVAWVSATMLGLWRYKSGRWMRKAVIKKDV
ncbi:MATE family efflux transporter [Listeria booriae]|uniref:MATE family efflux transporter n=1 Tax=Listeria booriae TaxID=1552123 RepID=A0A7X0XBM4_9LIST|nr:MATE family efflux transporter [Listeria booriae]MBC1491205.1 MATE family efflux transporter [Listeria booriae]MBC1502905.1 MATE family efflux transporter [Listeria booriae]MBC1529950.1 MATE family efflux transporter [Listeria booriae]MBC6134610.1 MATE family efflux transporter [Listeria booriae]